MSEASLFNTKSLKNFVLLAFYRDNIFGAFKTYSEQYIFLHHHFFLRMVWFKLKFAFSKLKIGMTKIFMLEEKHKIERKKRLNSDKIKRILTWPVPQN